MTGYAAPDFVLGYRIYNRHGCYLTGDVADSSRCHPWSENNVAARQSVINLGSVLDPEQIDDLAIFCEPLCDLASSVDVHGIVSSGNRLHSSKKCSSLLHLEG